MHRLLARRIRLTVRNPCTGSHSLHIARADHRSVSHAVAMFQRAFKNVSNDFHVAMGMGGKAATGVHEVFVNDAQTAKTHEGGIVVVAKRKRVKGVQPAKVEMAALVGLAYLDHNKYLPLRLPNSSGRQFHYDSKLVAATKISTNSFNPRASSSSNLENKGLSRSSTPIN